MTTQEPPSDQQLEKRRQFLEKLLSTGYDKAATFTQILIGAGYAGFFAIWNWVNPYLSRWQTLTIAALLGTSRVRSQPARPWPGSVGVEGRTREAHLRGDDAGVGDSTR